ncbi:SPOR domain-containing protein [Teredinibacter waterburyi]|uniref:SPOR domain-containing protein n=1 Tax=Teredinibacter waterburyi TaxID=1500538 RepID=UPI00165F707A|nr:AAA family ATPase [Teredinibacter waterburyi]
MDGHLGRELDSKAHGAGAVTSDDGGSADSSGPVFSTPALQALIQQMVHLVEFGEGLPLIQAVSGAGKTTLLAQLHSQLQHHDYVASVAVVDGESALEFVEKIADGFGLGGVVGDDVGEVIAELRHFAQALVHDQKKGILLVDDVHFLDDAALGALVSLLQGHGESGYGLGVVMASELGLVERIDALGVLEVPVYDFDVPEFSPSEVGKFLSLHFGNMQAHTNSLTPELVQSFWTRSDGYPGRILALVKMELLKSERSTSVSRNAGSCDLSWWQRAATLPLGHVAAVAVLGTVLVWALLFRGGSTPVSDSSETRRVETLQITAKSPSIETSKPESSVVRTSEAASTEDYSGGQVAIEDDSMGDGGSPLSLGQDRYLPPAPKLGEDADARAELKADRVGVAKSIASSSTKLAVDAPSLGAAGIVPPKSSASPKALADERFLLSRKDSEYTLQILAASQRESLEGFIAQQPNRDDLYLYRGQREGKNWYVVVAGVYPTRAAAIVARNALPERQRKAGPWPKALSTVKVEISSVR